MLFARIITEFARHSQGLRIRSAPGNSALSISTPLAHTKLTQFCIQSFWTNR